MSAKTLSPTRTKSVRVLTISAEEGDNLARSTKKKKIEAEGDTTMEESPVLESESYLEARSSQEPVETATVQTSGETPIQVSKSYINALFCDSGPTKDWMEIQCEDAEGEESVEVDAEGNLVIRVPKELKKDLYEPWRRAIIVKLLGITLAHPEMLWRLKKAWSLTNFDFLSLGNGYFVVNFDTYEDYKRVLFEGPVFMMERFLHVEAWRPNFRADLARIRTAVIWVRFPFLPPEQIDAKMLFRIARRIG